MSAFREGQQLARSKHQKNICADTCSSITQHNSRFFCRRSFMGVLFLPLATGTGQAAGTAQAQSAG